VVLTIALLPGRSTLWAARRGHHRDVVGWCAARAFDPGADAAILAGGAAWSMSSRIRPPAEAIATRAARRTEDHPSEPLVKSGAAITSRQ